MPVITGHMRWTPALLNRRNSILAAIAVIAAFLSWTIAADPRLSRDVGERLNQGLHGFETVAAMLSDRSPGQRPEGALASLKHKKHAVEAEATPPGPHSIPPVQAIMGTPAVPLIIPPAAAAPPLYNVVAGSPSAPIPVSPSSGGGGPPILPGIPSPGGGIGGGVIAPPPIVTQVVPPPPAVTSAIPEPASWVMMLAGFAIVGGAVRRQKQHRSLPAIG